MSRRFLSLACLLLSASCSSYWLAVPLPTATVETHGIPFPGRNLITITNGSSYNLDIVYRGATIITGLPPGGPPVVIDPPPLYRGAVKVIIQARDPETKALVGTASQSFYIYDGGDVYDHSWEVRNWDIQR